MKRRARIRRAKHERTKMLRAAATETPPVSLVADLPPGLLRPDDPDGVLYEAVCQRMWPDFLLWAIGNKEIREEFTTATGLVISPARSPIEAMIDKATGYGADVAAWFIEWVTVEIYGIEAAPAAYRAELARRRQEAR